MRRWQICIAASLLACGPALSGCGDRDSSSSAAAGDPAATPTAVRQDQPHGGATATADMKAFKDDGKVAAVTIEGNDLMQFNKNEIHLKRGQMVRLTLKHVGKLPAQSMGHNVVILKSGNDPFDFSADVAEHGGVFANNFLPDSMLDRVVAHTVIVGGGQSTTVEFRAPQEAGKYPFICSFPGHAGNMNGKVEVKD